MILLVPSTGDPQGLLVCGRAGSRPPVARLVDMGPGQPAKWVIGKPHEDGARLDELLPTALVLVLDGAPVQEGWNRFREVLAATFAGALSPMGGVILTCVGVRPKKLWRWVLSDWNGMEVPVLEESKYGPLQMVQAAQEIARVRLGCEVVVAL